jgi:hypothetical protein
MKSLVKISPPTPTELRLKLLKKWERGHFFVPQSDLFPYRVSLGTPSSSAMTDFFDELRSRISLYHNNIDKSYHIEWKEINHRTLGKNRVPAAVIFDTPELLAGFLSRKNELQLFLRLRGTLERADSRLTPWADRYPFELLSIGDELERLIHLWRWMVENPKPHIYLRQIDLKGIDTKFTEKYKGILDRWLELTLFESLEKTVSGSRNFEEKYGFNRKPEMIRFRFLDPQLYWHGCSDFTLPAVDFCSIYSGKEDQPIPVEQVIVIENDITALAFPPVRKGMVVFGRGYHFEHWQSADWLKRVSLWYWGDLDTHGFRILDQFRSLFPHTRSLLMDRKTLMNSESSWGRENQPSSVDLSNLTTEEKDLYDDLRFNRIRENLRLEQEFIPLSALKEFSQ